MLLLQRFTNRYYNDATSRERCSPCHLCLCIDGSFEIHCPTRDASYTNFYFIARCIHILSLCFGRRSPSLTLLAKNLAASGAAWHTAQQRLWAWRTSVFDSRYTTAPIVSHTRRYGPRRHLHLHLRPSSSSSSAQFSSSGSPAPHLRPPVAL